MALPVVVAMRVYYSSYHLWASRHFTRLAADIEDRHTGRTRFDIAHRSYVTNAVLSAVCFLEAAVNELYQDAADGHSSYISPLGSCSAERLAGIWRSHSRRPALKKFQCALLASGKQGFDKSCKPYQDVRIVIRLRNVLTHFKPETRTAYSLDALANDLRARKFPPNRLMDGSGNPFFPDHCLGKGCAEWAIAAAVRFADDFFARLGLTPNYRRVDFGPP